MSSVQKKCLLGSTILHGALFLLLVIGSAFLPPKDRPEDRMIELVAIPAVLIDENFVGGGSPDAVAPPPQPKPETAAPVQAPAPVQPPAPAPKPAEVAPPEEAPVPKPVPPAPVVRVNPEALLPKPAKPDPVSDAIAPEPAPKPKKPAVQVNLDTKVTRTVKTPATDADAAEQAERKAQQAAQAAAQQRSAQVANAIGSISTKASPGTTIGIPGPGGQAYAGYGIYLRDLYENAWTPPSAARDKEPVVEVEVTISREGKVLSAKITRKSGNVSLDNSVQRTLNRLRQARPLPEGTTDTQRIFKINFNLTTKLGSG